MARRPARPSGNGDGTARARRLSADARKQSILEAARRAFSEVGDVNGTTVKVIAEHGGISEGVIYRHFESKEQLFYEAVVEPLQEAIDDLVAATQVVDRDEPLNPERQLEALEGLYRQLLSTFDEILPLLGLVLFGHPEIAKRFYQESFAVAMNRLGDAWRAVEDRYGVQMAAPDVAARAVMGIALVLSLENQHNRRFDRDHAVTQASEGTFHGFFPPLSPTRKRR